MIIMKFGGTSVENAEAIARAADIVFTRRRLKPLVVVSACAGVTNDLIQCVRLAAEGRLKASIRLADKLKRRHFDIARGLDLDVSRPGHRAYLQGQFRYLNRRLEVIERRRRASHAELDAILAVGELSSSFLLAHRLLRVGTDVSLVDARKILRTDSAHGSASPLIPRTRRLAQKLVAPSLRNGTVVVTQGFIGSTINGRTTTLGRGGSDFSASIFGAALGAREIQIWTDVDGIFSADPLLVPAAKSIPLLTHAEASELARFGAKVLHPRTIEPAVERSIPFQILNSSNPTHPGTRVVSSIELNRENRKEASVNRPVLSIALKEDVGLAITRTGLSTIETIKNLSSDSPADKAAWNLEHVSSSHDYLLILFSPSGADMEQIAKPDGGRPRVLRNKSLLSLIGNAERNSGPVLESALRFLSAGKISVDYFWHEAPGGTVSLVVDRALAREALGILHAAYFPHLVINSRLMRA